MRRFVLLALALLAGLLIAAAGAVLLRGPQIAEAALRAALDRAGLAAPALAVRQVGWTGMTLGPLRLGGADGPAAAAVEVDWTVPGLLAGRIARARVEGLRLMVTIDADRVRIHGLPETAGGGGALPVDALVLDDAQVDIVAPAGAAHASVDATLTQAASGVLSGSARLDARLTPKGGKPTRLVADLPAWTLDREQWRIALTKAALRADELGVEASDVAMSADLAEPAMPFRLSGTLRDTGKPQAWPALAMMLTGQRQQDTVRASGEAHSADRAVVLAIKANHGLASGRGALEIDLAPVRFAAGGRQPADLFPAAGRSVQRVGGSIAAHATANWDARGSRTALKLDLADLAFDSGTAQLRGLTGRIALEPAWPPRALQPQRLTGQLAVAGLPAGALELVFSLPATDRLQVERLSLGLAGGELSLADVTLQRGRPLDATVTVSAVDIGAALALLGIDGLSGSGRLDGRIPVQVAASGAAIRDGALAADGPGRLRYTGDALPQQITDLQGQAGDAVRLAQQALTDFHYTSLKLGIDRNADGSGSLLLNLGGSNPAVLDGHPFVLNIRLEANFDRLALLLLDGYAAAEGMLRRAAPP